MRSAWYVGCVECVAAAFASRCGGMAFVGGCVDAVPAACAAGSGPCPAALRCRGGEVWVEVSDLCCVGAGGGGGGGGVGGSWDDGWGA